MPKPRTPAKMDDMDGCRSPLREHLLLVEAWFIGAGTLLLAGAAFWPAIAGIFGD